MSLYRCAACGSPNVAKVEKNDGFSYGKALVGTAVFGTIGAVAGINGKRDMFTLALTVEKSFQIRWMTLRRIKLIWS